MAHHKVNKNFYKPSLMQKNSEKRCPDIKVSNSSLLNIVDKQPHNQIRIYTDASYSIQTDIGVTSFIVTQNNEQIYSQSYSLNQGKGSTFSELVAINRALDYVYDQIKPKNVVELYTDSKMSVNIIDGKVKLKQSKKDYWKLVNSIRKRENARVLYVPAHTDGKGLHTKYNVQADKLCKEHLRSIVSEYNNFANK